MMFALLSALLLFGLAQANWLGNGQAEWSSRCALGSEMAGDYVCFTSPSDITQKGASGTWAGYAASDGKAFALIKSSDSGELMSMADHTINIQWLDPNRAHVIVQDYVNNGWVTAAEADTDNPDNKWIFQLSGGSSKRASSKEHVGRTPARHNGSKPGGHPGPSPPAGKGNGHGKHPPEA